MKQRPFTTLVVAIIVLGGVIGGAFAGGIAIGKDQGKEEMGQDFQSQMQDRLDARDPQQAAGQRGGGAFGGAFGGFQGGGGTVGIVDKVEGSTIAVETFQGTIQVSIGDETSIQKMGDIDLSEVLPGERVTVSGEVTADGSIQATNVFVTPELPSP